MVIERKETRKWRRDWRIAKKKEGDKRKKENKSIMKYKKKKDFKATKQRKLKKRESKDGRKCARKKV